MAKSKTLEILIANPYNFKMESYLLTQTLMQHFNMLKCLQILKMPYVLQHNSCLCGRFQFFSLKAMANRQKNLSLNKLVHGLHSKAS